MSCSWPAKVLRMLREAISQTCIISIAQNTDVITYSNQFVLCTGSEISSIGAEADTSDVQISNSINRFILQDANLLSSNDIENLC
jgi:hypothetical protein